MLLKKAETIIEWCIYQSRWLQVPVYLGMVVIMGLYSYIFCAGVVQEVLHVEELNEDIMLLIAIGMVDVSMILNLIVVSIIGGYWSFVSKLDIVQRSADSTQFSYLGTIGPNALKHKLMISLISISAVHLLEIFVSEHIERERAIMQIVIHLVFLLSALAITFIDKIGRSSH